MENDCETWLFLLESLGGCRCLGASNPQQLNRRHHDERGGTACRRSRAGGTVGEDPRHLAVTGHGLMLDARHSHWRLDGHAKQSGNEALVCDGARSHFLAVLAASSTFVSFSEARQGSTLAVVTPGRTKLSKGRNRCWTGKGSQAGFGVNYTAQDQGSWERG